MMKYKEEILKLYPLSKLLTVDDKKIVFLRKEGDKCGSAVLRVDQVDQDIDPWEQTWNELDDA